MRLSTERDRDDAQGVGVLHAAFDAGVTLLDTADAYCWDETDKHHNERLIARALATWSGDRAAVRVATKGGLTRPDGGWIPNGRAKHLVAACEASRRALAVERIFLYQLHAPDPRIPLATSVRALAALKNDGLVEHVGLCNVTVGQIEEARRITEIHSIQVELSIWHEDHVLSGVAEYCVANRIQLLAYRPLGGTARRQRTHADPTLRAVAARHGATPFEIAIAWLMDLSDVVVPVPGATRVESAQSIARATRISLTDEDRAELDRRFPAGAVFRRPPDRKAPPDVRSDSEVALVMGLPGAGKTTFAEALVRHGYYRLNRDETGGTLRALLPALDAALATGRSRVVLDNTYVSRKSRAEVLRAAAARGVPVRCIWLTTSVEDAQTNAAFRLVSRYGRLPSDAELKAMRKDDDAALLPTVQFRYQRMLEAPDLSEGFSRIDVVPFERRRDPSWVDRALIVWCDDVLLESRSGRRAPLTPDDTHVSIARGAVLRRYQDEGAGLVMAAGNRRRHTVAGSGGRGLRKDERSARRGSGGRVLSASGGTADLLVPEAAAGPWRRVHPQASARPRPVHLRRQRPAGSRIRAAARVRVPDRRRVLRAITKPRDQSIGLRFARICCRCGSRNGGSTTFSPSVAESSSTANPGPSVAISNRTPFGSRTYRLRNQ
jgi:aryl-alcohol dehydrogenase-like predicted oxidoreductase/predicted kinase